MTPQLQTCLDDLARRLDEAQEQRQRAAWQAFLAGEAQQAIFVPPFREPSPPTVDWPEVHINDALADPELMLLSQFDSVSKLLASGGTGALGVRCNYGVSILPSQYGCEVVTMPRDQHNTPTNHPLRGLDAVRAALDAGVPDLRAGQGAAVFETAERFLEVFDRYPVIGRCVELYHPDTQGPLDIMELVWGSEMFLAFYDEPKLVHAMLDLTSEHYIAFLRHWFELVPTPTDMTVHWQLMMPGRVMLRDDSLMNLSPELYTTFIRDREGRALSQLGGGVIHFCGRGDHFIAAMTEMPALRGINMSQPHLNDMDTIYANTIDRGIPLLGFNAEAAANAGRDLCGRVHCATRPVRSEG